jgi:RimJ/RimL family protein N-acetyltransferase
MMSRLSYRFFMGGVASCTQREHAPGVFKLETERLYLRELELEDAPFILKLLNDPDWLRFIGDRDVRTLEDAREYIASVISMYERVGHGLWLVVRKLDTEPLGICGLIARDTLPDLDVGLAFLPQFRRRGYAYEAASACLSYGRAELALPRIVAIATHDNVDSARLLERLGMQFETTLHLPEDTEELKLYARNFER